MKLSQLEYLVGLSIYGSFSAAARAMDTFQSTISSSIMNLEEELGLKLLIRGKEGISFTPTGKDVLLQATKICYYAAGARRSFSSDKTVLIGTNAPLCSLLVIPAIDALSREDSPCEVSVNVALSQALSDDLLLGKYDLVAAYTDNLSKERVNLLKTIGFQFSPLFQDKLLFSCRENHPLLSLPQITVSDILKYPCISYYSGLDKPIQDLFDAYHYNNTINYIMEVVTLRRFVASSDAVAIQSYSALLNGNRIYADKLVPLLVPGAMWETKIELISPSTPAFQPDPEVISKIRTRSGVISRMLSLNMNPYES